MNEDKQETRAVEGSRSFRHVRIAPAPESIKHIVDVRPKRRLHVRHVNPKQRDEKFDKEMKSYLLYKESAFHCVPLPKAPQGNNLSDGLGTSSSKNQNAHVPNQVPTDDGTDRSISNKNLVSSNNSKKGLTLDLQCNGQTNETLPSSNVHSPSALSQKSNSYESVSNVHVEIRPSSHSNQLDEITEKPDEESKEEPSLSARSPRKTKDHRPISAKSFRHKTKSFAISKVKDSPSYIPDLNSCKSSHIDSPYKDVTLFFLHGVGGSADIWNAQIDFFSQLGVEIIAPDLVGHGLSPAPQEQRAYHFKEILADLEAVFDKYCKRNNVIIGHSYG